MVEVVAIVVVVIVGAVVLVSSGSMLITATLDCYSAHAVWCAVSIFHSLSDELASSVLSPPAGFVWTMCDPIGVAREYGSWPTLTMPMIGGWHTPCPMGRKHLPPSDLIGGQAMK